MNITPSRLLYRESNNLLDEDSENSLKSDEDSPSIQNNGLTRFNSYLSQNDISPSSLLSNIHIKSPNSSMQNSYHFANKVNDLHFDNISQSKIEKINNWSKTTHSTILPTFKQNSSRNNILIKYNTNNNLHADNYSNYITSYNSSINSINDTVKESNSDNKTYFPSILYSYDNDISMEDESITNNTNELLCRKNNTNNLLENTMENTKFTMPIEIKKNDIKILQSKYPKIKIYLFVSIIVVFFATYYFQMPQVDINLKHFDFKDIINELSIRLFGQHIAVQEINNQLNLFIKNISAKILLLSFQGSTGTGKTYSAAILTNNLRMIYEVKNFIAPIDFSRSSDIDAEKLFNSIISEPPLEYYSQPLLKFIIIDEMEFADKFLIIALNSAIECLNNHNLQINNHHSQSYLLLVFNYLKSFFMITNSLDHLESLNNFKSKLIQNCQLEKNIIWKTIIILISQNHADKINSIFFKLLENNISRTDVNLSHFSSLFQPHFLQDYNHSNTYPSFNKFTHIFAETIESEFQEHWKSLNFNAIIPFLPLEHMHIKQCIQSILSDQFKRERNINYIDQISDSFDYFQLNGYRFNPSGCKKITSQIDLLI